MRDDCQLMIFLCKLYHCFSLQTVAVKSDPLTTVNPSYITSSIKTDDDNTEYMTLSNEVNYRQLIAAIDRDY